MYIFYVVKTSAALSLAQNTIAAAGRKVIKIVLNFLSTFPVLRLHIHNVLIDPRRG